MAPSAVTPGARKRASSAAEWPLAALIPGYEAAATVGDVVSATRAVVADVVVVDDGSTDATAAVARAAGAGVVRHPANRGKGAAIRTGLRHLDALGFRRAVVLDADGQHLPAEIPKLIAASDETPAALVLGVRDKAEHAIASIRLFANWLADHAISIAAGCPLADTQCGFRIYPITETLALGSRGDAMDFESEILILACRTGVPTREVTVRVCYPPPRERTSHYRPVEDTWRIGVKVFEAPARILAMRIGLGEVLGGPTGGGATTSPNRRAARTRKPRRKN
jgi:glycosyltransferase involved in cell wall biosynthesis